MKHRNVIYAFIYILIRQLIYRYIYKGITFFLKSRFFVVTNIQEVLGDKLITHNVLDNAELNNDTTLPSPSQLMFKILIKNKKLQSAHTANSGLQQKHRVFKTTLVYFYQFCTGFCCWHHIRGPFHKATWEILSLKIFLT